MFFHAKSMQENDRGIDALFSIGYLHYAKGFAGFT